MEQAHFTPRDRTRVDTEHASANATEGRDGLRVSLHVPTDGGRLCEGKRVTAEVYTNRPARIQIWSVLEDGRAFLIGPDPSLVPGGLLSRPGPVLHIDPLALPELGDEWLVAVAIPEGEPAQAATAPCRAGLWSAARLPEGSAVSSQTWTVLPEGTDPDDPSLVASSTFYEGSGGIVRVVLDSPALALAPGAGGELWRCDPA